MAGLALASRGVPTLAGPFVFSSLAFALSAVLLVAFLRPDPLLVSRANRQTTRAPGRREPAPGMRATAAAVFGNPAARLGITATAVGHLVMVGVMSMTPVHILDAGHDGAHTLRIVGLVLSFHIAGMFALAPLSGWLSDRYGRRRIIQWAVALLIVACVVSGMAGHGTGQLTLGLTLLGLGWSGTMVAGSTLLSESVGDQMRPSAQGLSDVLMGLAGASAGAVSGLVMHGGGYPLVALAAGVSALPLWLMAQRTRVN
jgi:MFS family permease